MVILKILIHVAVKIADMEKALLMIQLLCVMKSWKQQKVLWQKLFQEKKYSKKF